MRNANIWMVSAALLFGAAGMAHAQDQKAVREREALRRAQQQLQQATQARTELQGKVDASEKELDDARRSLDKAKARASSEGSKNKQLQEELTTTKAELQALQTQKAELEQRLAATATRLSEVDKELARSQAQRKLLEASVQAGNRQITSCVQSNKELYATGRGLIEECRNPDGAGLLRPESFSGMGRVALENRLEAFRDRLDAGKILPLETTP